MAWYTAHMETMSQPLPEKEPEIAVEEAIPADAAGIAHVQHVTWLATYPNEEYGITADDILSKDFEGEERVKTWAGRIEAAGELSHTWVARDGERVVGFCSVAKGDEVNQIFSIYVLPTLQGKGIGSQLFTRALEWLGDDKDTKLEVAAYNEPTIRFYQHYGFELGRPITHEVPAFSTGTDLPEVEMVRPKAEGTIND